MQMARARGGISILLTYEPVVALGLGRNKEGRKEAFHIVRAYRAFMKQMAGIFARL